MVITNPKFLSRLDREYKSIKTSQTFFNVELVNNNLQHWVATFVGPADTAYEGLHFKLDIEIGVLVFVLTDL